MRTIKVKANQSARTFTICTYRDNKFEFKYRTTPVPRMKFEEMENKTENDWKYFLSHSEDYYRVINKRTGI